MVSLLCLVVQFKRLVLTKGSMNAAGGGTNKPKVVDNKVYASVGGYVGRHRFGKKGTPDPKKKESWWIWL